MRVSEIAGALETTADTVRYYTRIGLLTPVKSPANGYNEYGQKDVRRLRFILSARQLGFTVADIVQIIAVADQGKTPCPLVRELIQQRLDETSVRYQEMLELRQRMETAARKWHSKPNKAPTGTMICHLIENWAQ